jgi:thioredoxin-like negative regulator of GroEL
VADTPNQKVGSNEVDALVGQAWSLHFHGQNDGAIQAFRDIVTRWPDHVDANYGLALTLKKGGQKAEAVEAFNRTKSLIQAVEVQAEDENARLQMLIRMIDQHLAMM